MGYVKAYFNSSEEARQEDWRSRCRDPEAVNASCVVPDQEGTFFFSGMSNMTVNQTVFGGKKSRAAGRGGVGGVVMAAVVVVVVVVGLVGEME